MSEGKFRTLSFFLNNTDEKERITFLKDEYGTGGRTWSEGGGSENHTPGDGITLQRGGIFTPDVKVNLKWNAVARRIDTLIRGGLYMLRPELDSLQSYENLILARNINSFYYELPEEYTRPFSKELDFFYPQVGYYLAVDKATGAVVGQIGLMWDEINDEKVLELGYILKKSYWHIGYATEGARACLEYGFDLFDTDKIMATIRPENAASIAVAERLGMKLIGEYDKECDGKLMKHLIYSINKKDVV